ncbi:DUF4375 domain-containing protein [Catellatospora sp. NPDC049111]|uniref:DMP19 family protein n=1 Tax=Catellatospora sp. NPDC049111 TaxID=3155271 RepID=UPI0033D3F8B5
MGDAQTVVLDLAHAVEVKAAHGVELSAPERVLSDLAWIDITVAPNGFLGWLDMSSADRLRETATALAAVGATQVGELVAQVFATVGLDPATMTDEVKDDLVEGLSAEAVVRLEQLGDAMFDLTEDYMARCHAYAQTHGLAA